MPVDRLEAVAAEVVAAIAFQPPDVGFAVGSHLYSKCAATAADGLSSQSSVMLVPLAVAASPVGRHGPVVLAVAAVGPAEVDPDFSPRTQTVYVVPELSPVIACEVSFERPSVPESGTSCHEIPAGSEVWVPDWYAYSNPSTDSPAGIVQVAVSELSLPDVAATVGVMLGMSVVTVTTDEAAVSPTSPVKSILTWNSYSVRPERPVTVTLDSLCASVSTSLSESGTDVQVAVHAVAGSAGLVRYLYCHWYAVKAELSAAGVVQLSVNDTPATLEVVGAATVGTAAVVAD